MRSQGGVVDCSQPLPNPSRGDALGRNTPQPALYDDLMERILDSENVRRAWKPVKANKGAPGVDEMPIEDFAEFARSSWPAIRQALNDGRYQPKPARREHSVGPPGQGAGTPGLPVRALRGRLADPGEKPQGERVGQGQRNTLSDP